MADAHGLLRANVKTVFDERRRLNIFSGFPPNLNNKGYGCWFEAFTTKVDTILERHLSR